MKVCAVTCTGDRPELLKLCRKWIQNQTVQPDEWLVSYDVDTRPETDATIVQKVGQVPERWTELPHIAKQNWNLYNALLAVPKDHIAVVFEDDDYYRSDHIEQCLADLQDTPVSCQPLLRIYDLPHRRIRNEQKLWPTEGCVALSPDAIRYYANLLPVRRNWDYHKEIPRHMKRTSTCIQLKGAGRGLPGRQGTTRMQTEGLDRFNSEEPTDFHRRLDSDLEGNSHHYLQLCPNLAPSAASPPPTPSS